MPSEPKGCLLGWLFTLIGNRDENASHATSIPPVIVNRKFISPAEAAFFQVIKRVVGDRGHVLAQVSLRQLLYLPGNNKTAPGRAAWQNKIAQKSVDFVVCDPSTLRPLIVIELDDATHSQAKRQSRDDDVHAILDAAKLPRIGVLTSQTYNTRELEAALAPHLSAR